MPLFGSHLSIAGGLYKAAQKAGEYGMDTVQIFTSAPQQWPFEKQQDGAGNRWQAKQLSEADCDRFQQTVADAGLVAPCAHDSYLINLGSTDEELWEKSIAALVIQLQRAERLGLTGVVMHPGSHLKSTPEEGLERISLGLDRVHQQTEDIGCELWLETVAGQGTNLGHRFEHLQAILEQVQQPERLGVCIDTCHIFAAGYPLAEKSEYDATFAEFDELIGIERIRAFHINDSKKPLGSRVDRHEHIGEGELGDAPFEHLVNDPRFARHPMYLETKKEQRNGTDMDIINLKRLNGFLKQSA